MKVHIDKGVPLPSVGHKLRADDLPWEKLEIGDSFVFTSGSSAYLKKSAAKKGIKILIKGDRITTTPRGGRVMESFRVWRIS